MEFSLQTFIELINGVGFPISMCVALFWLNSGILRNQQLVLSELKVSIQNNTNAVENLADSIKRN